VFYQSFTLPTSFCARACGFGHRPPPDFLSRRLRLGCASAEFAEKGATH
jgi:hypothetical protein